MREILFRGKRSDNGEWLEGYYTELPVGSLAATIVSNDEGTVCEDTASYIIKVFATQHSNYSNGYPLEVIECENYEVIPETLGQYTGLTDKNGNKIFEGDIVRYIYEPVENAWNANQLSKILWKNSAFYMEGIMGTNKYACMTGYLVSIPHGDGKLFEVVGNIHDNPELIQNAD